MENVETHIENRGWVEVTGIENKEAMKGAVHLEIIYREYQDNLEMLNKATRNLHIKQHA